MTSKISGYQNRPVLVGNDRPVSRSRDAAAGPAQPSATGAQSNPVQITDQARQLAALERAVQGLPTVNEARVAEIRSAIEEGRYQVEPERIAEKLLRLEHELKATEK